MKNGQAEETETKKQPPLSVARVARTCLRDGKAARVKTTCVLAAAMQSVHCYSVGRATTANCAAPDAKINNVGTRPNRYD